MIETFDPTDDAPGIVDYERPDTWPPALTALLDGHTDILVAHGREQHRINMLGFEGRWQARNRYKGQWDKIVGRADEILADEQLLGFHCTRLADDEIPDTTTNWTWRARTMPRFT